MDYPLSLALVDFLPVVAMAIGITLLVPLLEGPARVAAGTGGALVVLGGALKAVWKLLVAAGGPDVAILSAVQFYLFAPGFTLLAWAVLAPRAPWWAFAALTGSGLAAAVATGATWPLLLITTVCATLLSVRLLLLSRRLAERLLFGFNLLGTYAMGLLASRPEQTIALQWVEESLNTLIWTAFAVAVWRMRTTTPVTAPASTSMGERSS
ncbi:hypothetical protein [Nonomuraea soli]|uniref:Lysoplasmalogenase n=1 Tax=Nonomuraea soli TaxID=1032476 RepID=A0A7W0HPD6_9ACTN|nr:hypothetical protein [Nonomuraea soli]MBA2890770.1 hypothetical protein [Nonomuraea soli]